MKGASLSTVHTVLMVLTDGTTSALSPDYVLPVLIFSLSVIRFEPTKENIDKQSLQ